MKKRLLSAPPFGRQVALIIGLPAIRGPFPARRNFFAGQPLDWSMSVRVLSSATLLTLVLAVAGAVVLIGAQVAGNSMPRVAPAADTADGRSTAPAPERYTDGSTYVPTTGQDSSQSSDPMHADPD